MSAIAISGAMKACKEINMVLNSSPFEQQDEKLTAASWALLVATEDLVKVAEKLQERIDWLEVMPV